MSKKIETGDIAKAVYILDDMTEDVSITGTVTDAHYASGLVYLSFGEADITVYASDGWQFEYVSSPAKVGDKFFIGLPVGSVVVALHTASKVHAMLTENGWVLSNQSKYPIPDTEMFLDMWTIAYIAPRT